MQQLLKFNVIFWPFSCLNILLYCVHKFSDVQYIDYIDYRDITFFISQYRLKIDIVVT